MRDLYYESRKDTTQNLFSEVQLEYDSKLHFHRAFELAYIVEGKAKYTVCDREFIAGEGQIVFSHCYYLHKGHADYKHKKYIIATPENLSLDVQQLLEHESLPALMDDVEFNKTLLPHFEALINVDASTPHITIVGHLCLLFGALASHYPMVPLERKNKKVVLISDILAYIDEHCTEQISLDSIAHKFGYNKSYFSRLFNSYFGISLSSYINFVRLNRFEQLVAEHKSKNVTDLVYDAGFTSSTTYYRAKELREHTKAPL